MLEWSSPRSGLLIRSELEEMRGHVGRTPPDVAVAPLQVLLSVHLRFGDRVLSFMSTIAVLGAPVDSAFAELAIERSSRQTQRR